MSRVQNIGNQVYVFREQEKKKRLTGKDARKQHLLQTREITNILKTSFGPRGADKIIVSPDGDVVVTNDGATILKKIEIKHAVPKLLVDLSSSQDDQMGDGTTGVVVLAGALLEQAEILLDKGMHPVRIIEGYHRACKVAIEKLEEIAVEDKSQYKAIAMTALCSKIVGAHQTKIAEVVIKAVEAVADINHKDLNLDFIKLEKLVGGELSDTFFMNGIVLAKEISHSQMEKKKTNPKIAILTCAFEPPKPKTKHKIEISTVTEYDELYEAEQNYFKKQIESLKKVNCDLVICQWGFDDEANHLLYKNNITAIRWVGGQDIESIAMATRGTIIARFEDLTEDKLGSADYVEELCFGTEAEKLIHIKQKTDSAAVTIVVRGSNAMIVDEAERSIHDAICSVRNLIIDPRVVAGGGACEMAMAIATDISSDQIDSLHGWAVKAFSDALTAVVECLADNCGFNFLQIVGDMRKIHIESKNHNLGLNPYTFDIEDMLKVNTIESFTCKRLQIQLATQVVSMILRIDDVMGKVQE